MANAIRSTPAINQKCEQSIIHNITKFMYTLVDILDEGSKFQNTMFIGFLKYLYCSRDEIYFPKCKLSCLVAADGGTLNGQHTVVAMHHIHDVTKPLWRYCCIMTPSGCLGDVSNEDLAIIENNKFTNLVEQLFHWNIIDKNYNG